MRLLSGQGWGQVEARTLLLQCCHVKAGRAHDFFVKEGVFLAPQKWPQGPADWGLEKDQATFWEIWRAKGSSPTCSMEPHWIPGILEDMLSLQAAVGKSQGSGQHAAHVYALTVQATYVWLGAEVGLV